MTQFLKPNRLLIFTTKTGTDLRIIPWGGLQIAYVSGPQQHNSESPVTGLDLTERVRNAVALDRARKYTNINIYT